MKQTVVFIVFGLILFANCGDYRLVRHSQQRGAACLDGSPPAMYVHEGSGPNRDKFLVYMQGGDSCGEGELEDTLEACYQRSLTDLGSS